MSLLLLPLDARPCTYRFPADIAAIAGLPVLTPPPDMLGDLQRPADPDALISWLTENAPQASALVIATDTLAYGGLIPSRRVDTPLGVLQQRLATLVTIKQANPQIPLYAFSVTMRLSDSNDATEEKSYWADYGKLLYRHSYHLDKYEQEGDATDLTLALEAKNAIPDEILADYLDTRARNFTLNRMLIDWTQRGLFDLLLLTQDDTSRFGFNVKEQRMLASDVAERRLEHRVLIYPGADEVASVLVARHLNRLHKRQPAFLMRTSTPYGGRITAMYEDRPLERTVLGQVTAVGGRLVRTPAEADLMLMLNTPSTGQGDLALRLGLDRVDTPPRDLNPFVRELESPPKPVALADVAYANGGDPELFKAFKGYADLAAFAAWNTAGNTIGTVVAQASAFLVMQDPGAQTQFLLDRMADDILYQSQLRPKLQEELAQGRSIDDLEAELPRRLEALWNRLIHRQPIAGLSASFPWQRLFEADIRVHRRESHRGSALEPDADRDILDLSGQADPPGH